MVTVLFILVVNLDFTPHSLAIVLSLVELPFFTVKPNLFFACMEDEGIIYGRVVALLRVIEDEEFTMEQPQVVDMAVLRLYKIRETQDTHSLRTFISCTRDTTLTLVTNIRYQFNVVPLDLDFYVKQCEEMNSWNRAHWNSWENKEYKGKLIYVPRF